MTNTNNQMKRGVRKYYCWCNKQ